MINIETELELIYKQNEPRYNARKWYLKIIGLDYSNEKVLLIKYYSIVKKKQL